MKKLLLLLSLVAFPLFAADKNINQLTVGTDFASDDKVPFWDTSASVTKAMAVSTLFSQSHATIANAMGALAINTAYAVNTKSITADSTFTFSAAPATDTWFSLLLTTDATARIVTIPSSYSMGSQATITSFTAPPSSKTFLTWHYNGSTYELFGEPSTDVWVVAISDETTAITTGESKATFHAPYAATIVSVFVELNTVSSSGAPAFDIEDGGTTIFSTTPTIDANELTTDTAATPSVISDNQVAAHALLTFDIDTAGTGAKGAKVHITVIH